MLTGIYDLTLELPSGPMNGTLTLSEQNGSLTGFLQTSSGRFPVRGAAVQGGFFRLEGTVPTPLGPVRYSAQGEAGSSGLRGRAHTLFGTFPFSGVPR